VEEKVIYMKVNKNITINNFSFYLDLSEQAVESWHFIAQCSKISSPMSINKRLTRDGYKFSVHLAMTSLGAINLVVSE